MNPRVALGLPFCNNARYLPEALESLLAQTDADFGLVLLDDGSSDGSWEIAQRFRDADPRVRLVRHDARRGLVAAWRSAFTTAIEQFPSAQYFAWASDHDRWAPEWLARLRAELDAHPDALLAYPRVRRIDADGRVLVKESKAFDTAGLRSVRDRWVRFASDAAGAGDLVYGLMRVSALTRAGVFRPVLQADRLLMLELTLQGEFRQVPEVLWYRRTSEVASVAKQRWSMFTAETRPAGLWWPAWAQHARALWREHRGRTDPAISTLIALYVGHHLLRGASKSGTIGHQLDRTAESVAWGWKALRGLLWAAWYESAQWGGRVYGRLRRVGRRAVYETAIRRNRVRDQLARWGGGRRA